MSAGNEARLILISGLSGSGKSAAAKSFEDLGFHCVDNLPLPLLRHFLEDPLGFVEGNREIAVVTDIRAPGFAAELPRLLADVDRTNIHRVLLFLEASDEVLLRRFTETRRAHPLAENAPLIDGLRQERELLSDIRGLADVVFDTTEWNVHDLRERVFYEFAAIPGEAPGLVVSMVSFGFKYGLPYGTDLLFDVRHLTNPHFIPELRPLTGLNPEIVDFLEQETEYPELVDRIADLLLYLLPRYQAENRRYLSVAVGCTGGRHRSVATAEALARRLETRGWPLRRIHRDIDRAG